MTNLSIEQILPQVRNEKGLYSVLDIIRVCGQADPYNVLKRISNQYPQFLTKCQNLKFQYTNSKGVTRRTKGTPAATPLVALEIIGLLPGFIGNKYREEAASLMHSYLTDKVGLAEKIIDDTDNQENLKRIEKRAKGKIARLNFSSAIEDNLPDYTKKERSFTHAVCTNKVYEELFGGSAKELKLDRRTDKLRDSMSYEELVALEFTEMIAGNKIREDKSHLNNHKKMANTSKEKAQAVRKLQE